MKPQPFLCAALFLASCVTGDPDSPGKPEGPRRRNLAIAGSLKQSCPGGVLCDENFDYHAYAGEIDSVSLYISFKPAMVKDKSAEGVLAAFNYLYFTLSFPSLATDSSIVYVTSQALFGRTNDSSSFKSEVTGYANGKLRGRIAFPVERLTEKITSRAPGCIAGDIAGICYKSLDLGNRIDYVIDYEVELRE